MANVKITELGAIDALADADLIEVVDDVAGTPTSKKSTWTAVKTFLKAYFDTLYGPPIATDPIWAAAGDLLQGTGNDAATVLPLGIVALKIVNLKPVVNAAVNKLDIFSKSGGAAFDATDYLTVSIPDGTGYTSRTRKAAVASGTGQIILADATDYWSKGGLAAEIKTAYLYAIWSAADGGIVFALNGYSGFTRCPASVTATDDDYMHLEASSSYTPVITDYCVAIAKIRYEYDTGDAPDHTIQATALDAPQVCWNPKSDYGYQKNLAATNTSGTDIVEYSAVSAVIKQSGKYTIHAHFNIACVGGTTEGNLYIKTGSSTYGSAVVQARAIAVETVGGTAATAAVLGETYLNAGDTIHLGANVTGASGNRTIYGGVMTALHFKRSD